MNSLYTNISLVANLHKKASSKSEVVTQIIFGERFSIQKKLRHWLKIKIKEDGYKGYIKRNNYYQFLNPTHKVCSLKAKVYKSPNYKKKVCELTFGSKIKTLEKKNKFFQIS